MDRFGPDIFSTLRMRGVLYRARAHLKVRVDHLFGMHFSLKRYLFLSRLNEINGYCGKILPVVGSF